MTTNCASPAADNAALKPPFGLVLQDGDLVLSLMESSPGNAAKGRVPFYKFHMSTDGSGIPIGSISLRIGDAEELVLYFGHIGYGVEPAHRGHHYAERACRLLLPLARSHGLDTLWITCNPENLPSRRTCEKLGAVLVETVDVPRRCDLYRQGERKKCRYRLDLTSA
jgi:predicted acetyltransferase